MPQNKNETTGLPPGLARPAIRALHAAGITRLEQCARYSDADLARLHGIGPRALDLIRAALHQQDCSIPPAED